MGMFSRKPDPKEVKGFGRGKWASGKAAEKWAAQEHAKARGRRADAARRAARKGK